MKSNQVVEQEFWPGLKNNGGESFGVTPENDRVFWVEDFKP